MINKFCAGAVLLVLAIGTATAADLENLVDIEIPQRFDGPEYTLAEVANALAKGCAAKAWRPQRVSESEITCSIKVRGRHYVKVSIPFTTTSFSILYADSSEMDYNEDKQKIHRNYGRWVANLEAAIHAEFAIF